MAKPKTSLKPHVVEIEFSGKTYNSRLTFADIRKLKEEHGIDLFGGGGDNLNDPTVVVKILLVAMQHDDPDLTYDDVEQNLDLVLMPYLGGKIGELVGTKNASGKPNQAVLTG